MQTSDSRKRQAEAADVEALAEVLWAATVRGATAGEPLLHEEADNLAGAVLASGWLAADRAAAERRGAAEALREMRRLAVRCYPKGLVPTATVIADLDERLSYEADRIGGAS